MIDIAQIRRIALALPHVEERPCYGTPAFYIRGKLLARLHEDGETLVVKIDRDLRDALLDLAPDVYRLTPHYAPYPMVLMRLSAATTDQIEDRLAAAWRAHAPKRLLSAQK